MSIERLGFSVGLYMGLKLSHFEALTVLTVLSIIAVLGGSRFTDWSAALAVFLGFLHAQLSFDLADAHDEKSESQSNTGAKLKDLFVLKEIIWIVTFTALGSYPLLAGALLFMAYPAIRRWLRHSTAKPAACAYSNAPN